MHQKLTDASAKSAPCPEHGNKITYDEEMPGFGLRVTSAGARSWVLNFRARGIERRMTIGSFPAWNTKQARKRAAELLREIDAGRDPMAERHAERAAPTVNDLAARFEAEHLPKKRPSTAHEYRALLRDIILPSLGKHRVADLHHAEIEAMHAKAAARTPYRANRALAVLSKMLSLAVRWEMRADNPAHGIERAPEEKRQRYLTPAEIARLSAVLVEHPERTSANAVRLLLLTGARKGETLAAKWQDFDIDAGAWTKPAATTKRNKLHRVPLSAPALALLHEMKAEVGKGEYLFPGSAGKPLGDLKHFWTSVTKSAGLQGVRVHDLRHTYASILASSGLSLPIIGALLGHTQASTTQRYAHLLDDPLRAATERAGAIIGGAGKPSAEVRNIRGGRRA